MFKFSSALRKRAFNTFYIFFIYRLSSFKNHTFLKKFLRVSSIFASKLMPEILFIRLKNWMKGKIERYDLDELNQEEDVFFASQIASNNLVGIGLKDYPITVPSIPFGYLEGLIHWLGNSDYDLMSYNDLAFIPNHGQEQEEFSLWIKQAEKKRKKSILIQYDVDALPQITESILDVHIKLKVPANVMIFRKKIFDWKLRKSGILEYDDSYKLNFDKLIEFQKIGGVIGYHCNAFDRSNEDEQKALDIFAEDILALRKHLDINFFSMHGGIVTAEGKCNGTLPVQKLAQELNITWVHNGHSVYFHRNWADGSASNPKYKNECGDFFDFIIGTQEAERTRLLFHPQYYHNFKNDSFVFPILKNAKWVKAANAYINKNKGIRKSFWNEKYQYAKAKQAELEALFTSIDNEKPIFINGMSRTGTTLLASMFDAHPDFAMAYESYPRYLCEPSDNGILTREEYLFAAQTLKNYEESEAFRLLDRPPLKNLIKFAAVSTWTGMNLEQIGDLLTYYLTCKSSLVDTMSKALDIIAATARFKMFQIKARHWGTKCQGNYDDYFNKWPNGALIYILRNGLDVYASQKVNGKFNPDPFSLGKNWRSHLNHFINFKKKNPDKNCIIIKYENLVTSPEIVAKEICASIGVEYNKSMSEQHKYKNTLIQNPRGQLSVERIKQPIDNSSINRWIPELDKKEVSSFLMGCGGSEELNALGYEMGI